MAHAGTGGLQRHSIGPDYPFTLMGTMRHAHAHTEWVVFNCITGARSQAFRTSQAARIHLTSLRIRNMMHS